MDHYHRVYSYTDRKSIDTDSKRSDLHTRVISERNSWYSIVVTARIVAVFMNRPENANLISWEKMQIPKNANPISSTLRKDSSWQKDLLEFCHIYQLSDMISNVIRIILMHRIKSFKMLVFYVEHKPMNNVNS